MGRLMYRIEKKCILGLVGYEGRRLLERLGH
jgi:hypothetical protein